jgi:hypothetical protein
MTTNNEYEDYQKIVEDSEDLHVYDFFDEEILWENYYHTITDELIED